MSHLVPTVYAEVVLSGGWDPCSFLTYVLEMRQPHESHVS